MGIRFWRDRGCWQFPTTHDPLLLLLLLCCAPVTPLYQVLAHLNGPGGMAQTMTRAVVRYRQRIMRCF